MPASKTTSMCLPANNAPVLNGAARLDIRIGELVQYNFNVTDPGDTFVVNITGDNPPPSPTLTSTANGSYTVSFTINSTTPFSLEIVAIDSFGSSALLVPLVVLCPCQNNQPCLEISANEAGGNATFVEASCDCSPGKYTVLKKEYKNSADKKVVIRGQLTSRFLLSQN